MLKADFLFHFYSLLVSLGGPCSSVGIATAYGLDGPGIESRWGRDFPQQYRPALRPSGVPRNFFLGGGGSTNSVEDRENGDLGVVAP